jgi:23S rRNA-/tRNA-specific pseudouridylate synthase
LITAPGLIVLKHSDNELVVWKPAGLAAELRDGDAADSLKALVTRALPGTEPKLPHRLDRVTRGILVVALTPQAIAFHNEQIRAGAWEKHYLARVAAPSGKTPADFLGQHRAFLKEERGRAVIVRAGGKPSWLEIVAAAPTPGRPDRWHLVIRLMTGRFHQIRVMCAALGLPLAGDPLYDPERRDPADFYLEHAVLRYEDFDTRARASFFVRDHAERGALAPELSTLLQELAR